MAHIHMGAAGVSGNVVVAFTPAINFTNFDSTGFAYGAVVVDPILAANITANPAGFYVNVHSVTYPNGRQACTLVGFMWSVVGLTYGSICASMGLTFVPTRGVIRY